MDVTPTTDADAGAIIALERQALDRWGAGDPGGFFAIMAADETYFDPATERRIDGLDALQAYMAPFVGKIAIDRYEMANPKVQRSGDLAVLSFNLVNEGASFDGGPKFSIRWNRTEVFQRIGGQWRLVHSHWSYVQPVLKDAVAPV